MFWNKKNDEWWVFFEYFRSHKYGAVKSKNGIDWIDLDSELHFPEGAKHGTVFEATDPETIGKLKDLILPIDDDDW